MEQSNIQWLRKNVDWLNEEVQELCIWDEDRLSDFQEPQDWEFSTDYWLEEGDWRKKDAREWIENAETILTGAEEMKLMIGRMIGDIIETSAKATSYDLHGELICIHWDQKVLDYWEEDLRDAIVKARETHFLAEEAKSIVTSRKQGPISTEYIPEWVDKNMKQLYTVAEMLRVILDFVTGSRIEIIMKKCPQEVAERMYIPSRYEFVSKDPTGLKELLDDLDSGEITPEEM